MQTEIKTIAELEKELHIALEWSEVSEDYSDLLARYAKVPLKGFRAGKVPAGLIESTYKNELTNDLASMCAPRFCRKAMDENGLQAASPLELTSVALDKGKSLAFTARFIEVPEFDLPDYKHLSLTSQNNEEKLDEVSLKLLEKAQIKLHKTLIENELLNSELSPEEASEDDRLAAGNRVKLMLILKKIARQDSVEVDEKDVALRIEQVARENDVTPEQLREYLMGNGGLEPLKDALLAEQALQYIIDIQQ